MKKKLLMFLLLQIVTYEMQSQTLLKNPDVTYGSIGGIIADSISNESIIDVNCLLDSIFLGALTDIKGQYLINKVPPGFYRLHLTVIGYEPKIINDIEVLPNKLTEIDSRIIDLGTSWAKRDINKGNIQLFCPCDILSCDYPDSSLTDKYGFRYNPQCDFSVFNERYNKVVGHYLDVRYGKGWESELNAAWKLKTLFKQLRKIR